MQQPLPPPSDKSTTYDSHDQPNINLPAWSNLLNNFCKNNSIPSNLFGTSNDNESTALQSFLNQTKQNQLLHQKMNKLQNTIFTQEQLVFILENIKRVSRFYIFNLYQMVNLAILRDNDQLEQLAQEIFNLETELSQWERNYNEMSLNNNKREAVLLNNNKSNDLNDNEKLNVSNLCGNEGSSKWNNVAPITNSQNEIIASLISAELLPSKLGDGHQTLAQSLRQSLSADDLANLNPIKASDDHFENMNLSVNIDNMLVPLAHQNEMLMNETLVPDTHNDDEEGIDTDDTIHHPSNKAKSTKSRNTCPHPGCKYSTTQLQRLTMHQRLHNGETMYLCDVPDCEYQTNVLINVKKHRKNFHKMTGDDLKKPITQVNENGLIQPDNSSVQNINRNSSDSVKASSSTVKRQSNEFALLSDTSSNYPQHPPQKDSSVSDANEYKPSSNAKKRKLSNAKTHNKKEAATVYKCSFFGCTFESRSLKMFEKHQAQPHDNLRDSRLTCSMYRCNFQALNIDEMSNHYQKYHMEFLQQALIQQQTPNNSMDFEMDLFQEASTSKMFNE